MPDIQQIWTYKRIYDTEAEIITTPQNFRIAEITKVSGDRKGKGVKMYEISQFKGVVLSQVEIAFQATYQFNWLMIYPGLIETARPVFIFENLDAIEPQIYGGSYMLTDTQLEYFCEHPLDHVAVTNLETGDITRFQFADKYTTDYDGRQEWQELLKTIANRISAQKAIIIAQGDQPIYEDVIQVGEMIR